MKGLSESLAGRCAIFELPGISMGEYPETVNDRDSLHSGIINRGEIKSAKTISRNHLKNLRKEIVVSLYENTVPLERGIINLPWNRISELFEF